MKNLVLIFSFISTVFLSSAQGGDPTIEYHLGFNLMPNFSGDLVSFGLLQVRDGKVLGSTPLSREKFVQYAGGIKMNPANPELENLFIKYEVDSCWINYDADYYKYGKKVYVSHDCYGLDNLWKIRYKKHPYEHGAFGWSNGDYNFDGKQAAFLKKFYNVQSQAEYFYGENAFKLLKDMADEEWFDFYQAGDLTWGTEGATSPSDKEDSEETDPEEE